MISHVSFSLLLCHCLRCLYMSYTTFSVCRCVGCVSVNKKILYNIIFYHLNISFRFEWASLRDPFLLSVGWDKKTKWWRSGKKIKSAYRGPLWKFCAWTGRDTAPEYACTINDNKLMMFRVCGWRKQKKHAAGTQYSRGTTALIAINNKMEEIKGNKNWIVKESVVSISTYFRTNPPAHVFPFPTNSAAMAYPIWDITTRSSKKKNKKNKI